MAIRKDHTHDSVLHQNAYIRIDRFEHGFKDRSDASKMIVRCWAGIYADKPQLGEQPICMTNVDFAYNIAISENLLKQAYVAMKAMPEWVDALDDI